MEDSLPQIINTKNITKTARSSRIVVQNTNRKTMQFHKGDFTSFNQMETLENKEFCKFNSTLVNFYKLSSFLGFGKKIVNSNKQIRQFSKFCQLS